ncbi:hypothetical protein K1719_033023 [Acacia pycnantha]|nr:hypothetical protein K1719_033023 [Acacia pycnantha]
MDVEKMGGNNEVRGHVLMVAFPGYGHIAPMIQLARRLAFKGIKVTFASSLSLIQSFQPGSHLITLLPSYDDLTHGPIGGPRGLGVVAFLQKFQEFTTQFSLDFINKSLQDPDERRRVKCFIYDFDFHWALDVAKQAGVISAAFHTQVLGSTAAYYMIYMKLRGEELRVPPLDIPDFSHNTGISEVVDGPGFDKISPVLKAAIVKFGNLGKADFHFCLTFDKLEHEVLEWMKKICPTMATIGPMVPSAYLDNRMEDNTDYGFIINDPDTNMNTCLEWLNTKEPNSVVYIAFGSMADIESQQVNEIAMALKSLGCNFLWVMKQIEMQKNLPSDFLEEMSEKGMFVKWCPQLQVLSHPAVGYIVTHCGANSIVEATVLEVPMLGLPRYTDQIPNAYYVEEVWKVGVNAKKNGAGVYSKEEIERCFKELMYEEKGEEIRKNLKQLRQHAVEAVSQGGSSDMHIEEFIARLVCGT